MKGILVTALKWIVIVPLAFVALAVVIAGGMWLVPHMETGWGFFAGLAAIFVICAFLQRYSDSY